MSKDKSKGIDESGKDIWNRIGVSNANNEGVVIVGFEVIEKNLNGLTKGIVIRKSVCIGNFFFILMH